MSNLPSGPTGAYADSVWSQVLLFLHTESIEVSVCVFMTVLKRGWTLGANTTPVLRVRSHSPAPGIIPNVLACIKTSVNTPRVLILMD